MALVSVSSAFLSRASELDTLAAILPPDRRDALADILTDGDIATLKHLVDKGLGANTLRAMTSDLTYIDGWCRASTGHALPWPAPQPLLLKFIAHHLWDAEARAENEWHGMPDEVRQTLKDQKLLRGSGPSAVATVRRRLALWSTLHQWRGLLGPFNDPHVKTALKSAIRASYRPVKRKSARALTWDMVDKLVDTCRFATAQDVRDRALILVAFASGGRRRSEMAGLRAEHLTEEARVPAVPGDPHSERLRCYSIRLGRTKTENGDKPSRVVIVGKPADALAEWLKRARITSGPIFRSINRWGQLAGTGLTPEAVNLIVKRRCRMAGLDPALYSAHGLRSGYMTEAARRRVPLPEAMQQSRHRSVQQAAVYYNEAERSNTHAARLAQ
jgi:integrase